jgi:hypothetical protein
MDLLWARDAQGPWLPIITQLENTGFYEWKLPPRQPGQFYVRVTASDTAGNVSTAETPGPVVLDPNAVPAPEPGRTVMVNPAVKPIITEIEPENTTPTKPAVTFEPVDDR